MNVTARFADWLFRFTENPKEAPRWATLLVLAEGPDGDLWLPNLRPAVGDLWWDRRLDLRRPTHWPYFLLSRLTGWVVILDDL